MNTVIDTYKQAVLTSSLLDPYQRDAMLDGVEEYPEEYLVAITEVLKAFEKRSQRREADYKEKLTKVFDRYEQTITAIPTLDDAQRKKLLTQAQMLKNVLIPDAKPL